jgi:cold shock protein
MNGSIKFYNDEKGFGFIIPEDGSDNLFFHVSNCAEGWEPEDGQMVTFNIGEGRDGRACATEVNFGGEAATDMSDAA